MTIFKNGFPFRGLLEFKRRKREYIFLGSNSYASIGKIRLSKDSLSTDLTKGKVKYSTTMSKLHVSQPFLPKVLYENSSRFRQNIMANRIIKKEIRRIKLDYSSVIKCIPICYRISNCHSNLLCKNYEIIPGIKNCKIRLIGCSNCRFYSQISLEDLTFGEILSKRKNVDSSEKDYSLSSKIPSYMFRHSKYPTLAVCPKVNEPENIQTQNTDVSYYSFDSNNVNSPKIQKENIVKKPVSSLAVQKKETEISFANECKLSNDFIKYISVDKIPKNTLHLSTLYEQCFSSKIYFVKLNKIDNESEVKIRKISRQLYPLNRKHIVLSDPILKYLHFFKTYNEECSVKIDSYENIYKEIKLCLNPTDEHDHVEHKPGIREKPVPRDQLPPNISNNSQNIFNIINSIDRSEAIIHKDLYITNKVVDLLKEQEKKKENQSGTDKKDKLEDKDSQKLLTSAGPNLIKINEPLPNETIDVQNEGVRGELCGINAVKSKAIPANTNEDVSNKYEFSAIESEKNPNQIHNIRYESCGINSEKKLPSEENNLMSTSTNHSLFKNNGFFVTETGKQINYSKSSKSQEINPTDTLFSYDGAENNLNAPCSNEDSNKNSESVVTDTSKVMRQTSFKSAESSGIYPVKNLPPQDIKNENKSLTNHVNQYSTNKNELLANITTNKDTTKVYITKNGSAFGMIPVEKLSQNSSVDRKTVSANHEKNNIEHSERSNSVTVIPLDKKIIGNQRDTRTPSVSHFTYPPSFVDNVVTNLRNPSSTRTSQATASQCRGSHSKTGNESDCTVDVLTETSITSTKFGERAKIKIHEVQTFKDRRLPLKFTTDTLMEMQGSNDKLRAATEVVEVAKAKLVLSRSNADADMKSGVENAIKLAELLSFLKHKVLVGSGIESKKLPIEIEPLHKENKPIAKQTTTKTSGSLPETKTTNLPNNKNTINMAETNLTDKLKQNSVVQEKKPDKLVTSKPPATTTSTSTEKQPTTKSLDLKDKLSESKQKTVDSKVMNKSLKKDKKPEDEVKVIKVRSQDLKKILNRSENTEHSIRLVEKMEVKPQEDDNLKKNLRKGKNKHLVEKKDKKARLNNKLGKQNLKKIFDIKPFVKNPTKNEAVDRKTTETLQKNLNHDKKPEVDLTARDLKIIEKIKKDNEGISNTTKNAAPVPSEGAQSKLENIKGENKDLSKSNKNIFNINNAKLSTSPVTYDVIKIPGDDEIKKKFQKPPRKEKEIIIIHGEKETGEVKEGSTEPNKTIKESEPETKEKESMEMVAVKEIQIKNDNEVLQSYKNVIIRKTHRKPAIVRKSITNMIEPILPQATSGGKKEEKEADKSRNQSGAQFSKKSDAAKLDSKNLDNLKQSTNVIKKEIDKYIQYQKKSAKISKSPEKITPVPEKTEIRAKDSKNIDSIKQSANYVKKDLASEKKSAAEVSKSSEIKPPVSKKSDVSAKDTKNTGSIKQTTKEVKKDLASEKKSAAKVDKSSGIKPPVSKKPAVSAKDSKNTGSIKPSAKEIKKDIVSEKKSAAEVTKSSAAKPPVSKKPDVSAKDSKNKGSIKQSAKEVKKDLATEKKTTAQVSKPSAIKPPTSKKPDVSAKDSKTISSTKQSAKEVKKDLATEKKTAAQVSKPSAIKPPVSKKPEISAKDSKTISSTKQSAKEVNKDLATEKKTAAQVSKPSAINPLSKYSGIKPPVSKKPDVSAKDSKTIGSTKQSAKEVKKDLASEKKSAATVSKSSEIKPLSKYSGIKPPVSKKPDVSAKDSKTIGSTKQSAKEVKKDLASEKKSAAQVSKSSEIKPLSKSSGIKPPVSKKPDVSVKDSKTIGSIKQSAKEVKKDLATEKKTAAQVSKSSEIKPLSKSTGIKPPVSKKPDVSAKDSKTIGSTKQSAKEVKKDLASEKKSAAQVSKPSAIKPPTSKKPDVSAKDSKTIGSTKQSAKEVKKDLATEKKSPLKDSKPSASKMPDGNALEKGISKEAKVKSGVTLDKQSQKPVQSPETKSETPKITKFVSEPSSVGSEVLSKPEIKDTSPNIKEPVPDSTPVTPAPAIPTSFAKTKSISLTEDINIDLDKLSKETKPALDVRSARKSLVSLDKLMDFPLLNEHKTLYEPPKDGIICVDCKKDLVLRQKLRIFPSVTRVLNATMSDSSRIALARWRSKMIADLGEAGFQEFYKGQIESGAEFHEKVQRHFSGHLQDLVNSPNPALRSISSISKYISDVSVVESHVIHNKLAYRGIIDCVAKYNNKPVLIEWKRSDKKKTLIQNTFDAPLQLCAYIGALNFDTNYNMQVQGGVVIVAYSDGTPADVFTVPLNECQKYWKQWLGRLKQYIIDGYGKS